MDLFTAFTAKDNLKKAFEYLKIEVNETSLPLDPIWKPAMSAVEELGNEFFSALQDYLRENKYQPDKANYIYADKDNMGVRPICIFSVVDRIVYQALLNPNILGNAIDKKLYSSCFGTRTCSKILNIGYFVGSNSIFLFFASALAAGVYLSSVASNA